MREKTSHLFLHRVDSGNRDLSIFGLAGKTREGGRQEKQVGGKVRRL